MKNQHSSGIIALSLLLLVAISAHANQSDSDLDGIPDSIEGDVDTDADGLPNYLDIDSDGDGQLDASEAGPNPIEPQDTDSDGIPDYLDLDSDNDGIPDSSEFAIQDTDGDGVPNHLDSDSDNDSIPDRVEGDINTDGDASPDYLDWDSDDDNIPDLAEAGNTPENPVDTDADGTPDYHDLDSDNDDIPDSVEGLNDADLDGIYSYVDTDSDNDGIPDSEEGVSDSDGDGIPDYLDSPVSEANTDSDGDLIFDADDRDDDNDGLMDFQEETLIDSDGDGVVDSKDLDSDNDGICDAYEGGHYDVPESCRLDVTNLDNFGIPDVVSRFPLSVYDTDEDGVPNLLDIDSDDDGLFDITENGSFDIDNNGLVDRFLDEDGDGKDDTTPTVLIDMDDDEIPDYIDPFIGNDEDTEDVNNPDQPTIGPVDDTPAEEPPAFETSVDGYGGGCSISGDGHNQTLFVMVLFAMIILLYKSRWKVPVLVVVVAALQGCTISNAPGSFKQSLYFATGIGVSRLNPEPQTESHRVTDSSDRSSSITIGADISNDFAIEFANHSLGEAVVGEVGSIDYDVAPSVSVLRYMFRDPAKQRLRVGFSGYGRLGAATIENDSTVPFKRNNQTTVVIGLGLEYIFYNGIGMRAELQSFDSDAQSATVGLTYRFGVRPVRPQPVKELEQEVEPQKVVRPPRKKY